MYIEIDMADVEITLDESLKKVADKHFLRLPYILFQSKGQSIIFQFQDHTKREAFFQAIKRAGKDDS